MVFDSVRNVSYYFQLVCANITQTKRAETRVIHGPSWYDFIYQSYVRVRPNRNRTLEISILVMLLFFPLTTTWAFPANPEVPTRKNMSRVRRCIFKKERRGNKNSAILAQKRRNIAEISVYYFLETIPRSYPKL